MTVKRYEANNKLNILSMPADYKITNLNLK